MTNRSPFSGLGFTAFFKPTLLMSTVLWAALAFAQPMEGPEGPSVEWQKVELEEKILDKLTHAVAPSLPEKSYVISVNIAIKPKEKASTDKAKADAEKKKAALDDGVDLGKLDMDNVEFDPQTPAAEVESIFDRIDKINVAVLLDNSVADTKKDLVRKIVEDGVRSVSSKSAEIKVDKADLITKPAPPEPWDLKKWLLELKLPITLLVVTGIFAILFGLVTMLVFRGYQRLESRRISVMEAANAREEAAAQRTAEAASPELAVNIQEEVKPDNAVKIEGAQKGFERLQNLLREDPPRVASLVRQWLKAPGKGSSEALAALPQVLATEEMLAIIQYLGMDDRREWKKYLGRTLDESSFRAAERFVTGQIVEGLLTPAPKVDGEVSEKVSGLQVSECIEIAQQDAALGAVLVNLLPSAQVSRMLASMPAELANSVTVESLKLSDEDVRQKSQALLAAMQGVSKASSLAQMPFLDKASEVMQALDSEREATLFSALAQSGEFKAFEEAARNSFPASLVLQLPPRVLKACLDRIPAAKRVEMIYSRREEDRGVLLESIGKPGSKARDIVDLELTELQGDEVRKRRIEKTRTQLWREFVESVRAFIRSNEFAGQQAEGILEAWMSQMTNGKVGGASEGTQVA